MEKIAGQRTLLIVKANYLIRLAIPLLCLVLAVDTDARTSGPRRASSRTETSRVRSVGTHTRSAARCQVCTRDIRGRIARSSSARRAFRAYNPCPATGLTTGPCTGYVIDHIQALKHRGADSPDNMQWQTREEAKAKDKLE
jgi:hypothetical protein